MKFNLTILFIFTCHFAPAQFSDSISGFPCKELVVYQGNLKSAVKEVKLSYIKLPNRQNGIALTYSTILRRENLHFSMPLDTILFYTSDNTLTLYNLKQDTIAYNGTKSPPENIHYFIYWRAFKVINEEQKQFLATKEIQSFEVRPKYLTGIFKLPLNPSNILQKLFTD